MMLKTSSSKMNPAINLFGFTLRKNLGFTAVATILVLLFSPVLLVNTIQQELDRLSESQLVNYVVDIDGDIAAVVCILAVAVTAFAWLMQIINFNYLNTKSGSDSFHSMPLTRTELFSARISACYISALIPLTAGYLGLFGIGFMEHVTVDNALLFNCYIYTVGMLALCMLFSQIFIFSAGCVVDGIISFLAVNIGLPVIIMLVLSMCDSCLFGFYQPNDTISFTYGTPFGFAAMGLLDIALGTAQKPFTIRGVLLFIVAIAVLVAVNILLYNKRKSEKSGEPFAFRFVPFVISVIISFIAFHLFGLIFDGGILIGIIMSVVGCVLTCVVYNAVVNRGFKKVKAAILPAAVSIALVLVSFLAINFDIFGYGTYLPAAQQVREVSVSYKGITANAKDTRGIESVINMHSAFIEGYKADEFYFDDEHVEHIDENGETYYTVSLTSFRETIEINYTLKDGRNINRIYHVANKLFVDEKTDFIREVFADGVTEEFAANKGAFFSLDGEFNGETISLDITADEAAELMKAYESDLKNVSDEYFLNNKHQTVYINTFGNGYYSVGIPNLESFQNTREVLEGMNIAERNTFYLQK